MFYVAELDNFCRVINLRFHLQSKIVWSHVAFFYIFVNSTFIKEFGNKIHFIQSINEALFNLPILR
jgi:hypothetical protein